MPSSSPQEPWFFTGVTLPAETREYDVGNGSMVAILVCERWERSSGEGMYPVASPVTPGSG